MREFIASLPEERQARIKARGAEILAEERVSRDLRKALGKR